MVLGDRVARRSGVGTATAAAGMDTTRVGFQVAELLPAPPVRDIAVSGGSA